MSALTIELPDSLYRKVADLARADGISVEQFIATATAEKMAAVDFRNRFNGFSKSPTAKYIGWAHNRWSSWAVRKFDSQGSDPAVKLHA